MQLTIYYRVYKLLRNGTHENWKNAVAKTYLQREAKVHFMGCCSCLHPVSQY